MPHRPESLDPAKRQKILALLANGSSRRVAARAVGCAHSTITRTAARDRQFAADLAAAEQSLEIEALRHIRRAAAEGRYWRAAAWIVERRNPRDFARRDPVALEEHDIAKAMLTVLGPYLRKLSDAELDRIFRHLDALLDFFQKRPRALGLLHSPDPQPTALDPPIPPPYAESQESDVETSENGEESPTPIDTDTEN